MSPGRSSRYAPLLGALFVILVLVGFVVAGDTAGTDALPAEIKDKYDDQAKHLIGLYLVALGAVALLFFASHLRGALRLLDPFGRMGNAALAGGGDRRGGTHGLLRHPWRAHRCRRPERGLGPGAAGAECPRQLELRADHRRDRRARARHRHRDHPGRRLIPGWFGWLGVVIGIVGLSPARLLRGRGGGAVADCVEPPALQSGGRRCTGRRRRLAVPPGPLPTLASRARCLESEIRALQRIYEALSRWDVDEFANGVTHDFVLTLPETVPWGGTRHGRDGLEAFRDDLHGITSRGNGPKRTSSSTPVSVIVVLGRLRGRARATGDEFEEHFAQDLDSVRRRAVAGSELLRHGADHGRARLSHVGASRPGFAPVARP